MSMIDPTYIEKALETLERAKQQAAVFQYIADNPHSYTHVIAREAGCINIPDCTKRIQAKIDPLGLVIAHYLPANRPKNRHGTALATHRWLILNQSYFDPDNEKPHQSAKLTGLDVKLIWQDNFTDKVTPIIPSRKQVRNQSCDYEEVVNE
jgi:hypothetical protein